MAPYLSSDFAAEDFDFNGRIMNGTEQMQPRIKFCIADTDNALGEALGKLYVKRAFSPAAKALPCL